MAEARAPTRACGATSEHDSVAYGVSEDVKDVDVHTNGIESLVVHVQARLCRYVPPARVSTSCRTRSRMSFKDSRRYVHEFAGRHNTATWTR